MEGIQQSSSIHTCLEEFTKIFRKVLSSQLNLSTLNLVFQKASFSKINGAIWFEVFLMFSDNKIRYKWWVIETFTSQFGHLKLRTWGSKFTVWKVLSRWQINFIRCILTYQYRINYRSYRLLFLQYIILGHLSILFFNLGKLSLW